MKNNLDISYIFSNFAPYKNNIINPGAQNPHNNYTTWNKKLSQSMELTSLVTNQLMITGQYA